MNVVAIGFVSSIIQHTIPKLSAVALHKVKTIVELVEEEYQLKIGKRWRDLRVDGEFIPGQVNSGIRVTSPNLKTKLSKYHLENTRSFEEQNKEDQPL